jgi:glycosyltransferase involved in cell wall biosynthesis
MEFSVIVPFFKAEPYIQRCVDGLLGQAYPAEQFEILMIDNNSPDGSTDIVKRHPRLTLLAEPTQGAYAARNRGARTARGSILVFTDPDCAPHPGWLASLADAFRDPQVEVLIGPSQPAGRGRGLRLLGAYEEAKERFILDSDDPTVYWGHTNNLAVRRTAWNTCGPFVERERGADVIFVRRVVDTRSCRAVRYTPEARVTHLEINSVRDYFRKVLIYARSHQSYRGPGNARALTVRERWRVFRQSLRLKHLSFFDAALLVLLLLVGQLTWSAGAIAGKREARPTATP